MISRGLVCQTLWICLGALLLGCEGKNKDYLIVSGRVEVDDIHVGSKIGGRVSGVFFEEGDRVSSGSVIVQLDDKELRASLEQARADTARAKSQLDLILAGSRTEDISRAEAVVRARTSELDLRKKGFREEEVRQAEAQLVSAQSELELAQREYERSAQLLRNRAIDRSEHDRTRNTYETARAQLEVAKQREALVKSGSRPEEIAMADAQLQQAQADLLRLKNGARPEEIAAQRAAVEAAAASTRKLEAQLDETRITSPFDVVVETLDLESGDLVRAGETVAVLNLNTSPWVRCYVPENRLNLGKPGEEVYVTIDSSAEKRLRGRIRRLSSEAEFTPRNVQTTEKRAELVFEMKVDVLDGADILRAGMYADVHIPFRKQ